MTTRIGSPRRPSVSNSGSDSSAPPSPSAATVRRSGRAIAAPMALPRARPTHWKACGKTKPGRVGDAQVHRRPAHEGAGVHDDRALDRQQVVERDAQRARIEDAGRLGLGVGLVAPAPAGDLRASAGVRRAPRPRRGARARPAAPRRSPRRRRSPPAPRAGGRRSPPRRDRPGRRGRRARAACRGPSSTGSARRRRRRSRRTPPAAARPAASRSRRRCRGRTGRRRTGRWPRRSWPAARRSRSPSARSGAPHRRAPRRARR